MLRGPEDDPGGFGPMSACSQLEPTLLECTRGSGDRALKDNARAASRKHVNSFESEVERGESGDSLGGDQERIAVDERNGLHSSVQGLPLQSIVQRSRARPSANQQVERPLRGQVVDRMIPGNALHVEEWLAGKIS